MSSSGRSRREFFVHSQNNGGPHSVRMARSRRPSGPWKNSEFRNLTLPVFGHSSIALNHITNSVKSAAFSKVSRAIWDGCRLPMHSPALSVVSLGGKRKFTANRANDGYAHRRSFTSLGANSMKKRRVTDFCMLPQFASLLLILSKRNRLRLAVKCGNFSLNVSVHVSPMTDTVPQ